VYRVTEDRTLNTTSTSNRQRAHVHHLAQTPRDMAYNPYHYQGDRSNGPQRRLTLDGLTEIDNRTKAASGITRWLEEGRRSGPWDGWVREGEER
jgi:hypothetical protein